MNRLIVLDVTTLFGCIHPVIIEDEKNMLLIDTGFPHHVDVLANVAHEKGLDLNRLTQIIITHQDWDHIGGLGELKRNYPQVRIASSKIEADYIAGKRKFIRLELAEKYGNEEDIKLTQRKLKLLETVTVDELLDDGDFLPICGGIRIIATPGHMDGHISVYAEASKTLITGDAIVAENGTMLGPNPQYTLDMPLAKKSIEKLMKYDIARIVCYHGGVFETDCNNALKEMLAKI